MQFTQNPAMIDFMNSAFSSSPEVSLFQKFSSGSGIAGVAIFLLIISLFSIVMLVVKGFALWRAARRGDKGWFIAMLIINLFGILEIVYLIMTREKKALPVSSIADVSKDKI